MMEVRFGFIHTWTSLATQQRPQKAWRVDSCRPRKSRDPTVWLPENCYALFFFFLGNGKKIYPSSRDESIQVVTGGFRILEGVQMTTTTPQCGIYLYLLRWFNELLNLENRSSSESVMIITGQRDWRTATEFLSLSSLVCLVRSKTAGLDTL